MDSSNGSVATPFSVIIPAINSGGVISNAGFITPMSSGAVFLSPIPVTSLPFLGRILTILPSDDDVVAHPLSRRPNL